MQYVFVNFFFFVMVRPPPRSTRLYTLLPSTTLFLSPDDARGDVEATQAHRETAADAVGIVFRLAVSLGVGTDDAGLEAEAVEVTLIGDASADVVVEPIAVGVAEAARRAGVGAAVRIRRVAEIGRAHV